MFQENPFLALLFSGLYHFLVGDGAGEVVDLREQRPQTLLLLFGPLLPSHPHQSPQTFSSRDATLSLKSLTVVSTEFPLPSTGILCVQLSLSSRFVWPQVHTSTAVV